MSRALIDLKPKGGYKFQWRRNECMNEYIWYIRRNQPLSRQQVEALKDRTYLESPNGPGWKAHIDEVRKDTGTLCCTTQTDYWDMLIRMEELYRILKDNE